MSLISAKSLIPFPPLAVVLVPKVQPVAPDGFVVYAMDLIDVINNTYPTVYVVPLTVMTPFVVVAP